MWAFPDELTARAKARRKEGEPDPTHTPKSSQPGLLLPTSISWGNQRPKTIGPWFQWLSFLASALGEGRVSSRGMLFPLGLPTLPFTR
ncbi:hypothetical protein NHX12_027564 [Muraenolepis orangiensis]|uniref:Uncharacterized protein n=1 Tax=Muraenolepis orangiensis TaxID=630683 RepID=A0A9Q0IPC4_9TELE|nr:hypothetical protein NHX12_027564 [Muraenolepis orangiensis]